MTARIDAALARVAESAAASTCVMAATLPALRALSRATEAAAVPRPPAEALSAVGERLGLVVEALRPHPASTAAELLHLARIRAAIPPLVAAIEAALGVVVSASDLEPPSITADRSRIIALASDARVLTAADAVVTACVAPPGISRGAELAVERAADRTVLLRRILDLSWYGGAAVVAGENDRELAANLLGALSAVAGSVICGSWPRTVDRLSLLQARLAADALFAQLRIAEAPVTDPSRCRFTVRKPPRKPASYGAIGAGR